MSTLAAARADNFYFPPEWTPKQGSLNKFQGQHPLRERARKIDQGILVIRFEMPFNVWCGGCHSMIAKGVRFNAEKKQIGKYYTTKIWSFSMKAACCKHEIEIHTDPKNCEYVIVKGAERKTETYDAADAGSLVVATGEDREKLTDPFAKLEHDEEDILKGKESAKQLMLLQKQSDIKHGNDYSVNRALRAQLRDQKKRVALEEAHSKKLGIGIRLLPASEDDAQAAGSVRFAQKFDKNRRDKRAAIRATSIFSQSGAYGLPPAGSDQKLQLLAKRRKIQAAEAQSLLRGRIKASSLAAQRS
ncbi:coiled-coil domain-containing protein 130 [Selaginella moellendorffii]|uniref:coiled-coil domain-containing protein 130 n=1 Tax=Selaginella moellendorffii TaxID=88036 RepID=UPI000D1CA795|nr:coiled-coil domain-containing protein 130 [Selaginella moellendorffii]|eukprot:XP_024525374.1 coiled-coil domain-containing protein 130 [Selaginella moellendorffii]